MEGGNVRAAVGALAVVLALGVDHGAAQVTADPNQSTQAFSVPDLLGGVRITEAQCLALGDRAVWVVVGKEGECIRYYLSEPKAGATQALIYLHDDMVVVNGRGEVKPVDIYPKLTPTAMQTGSASWSRTLRMPYLLLARPGTLGSSGNHSKRRTDREIEIVSAALDAIKARHRYDRLHLVGTGEGGHTAAALLDKRADLGCVVLASALLSVRLRLSELGRTEDVTGEKRPVDPISLVDKIKRAPDLRIFVLTDPDDTVISAHSQALYAKRLAAAGLPVHQLFAPASDAYGHILSSEARRLAADCAQGLSDEEIAKKYDNIKPEHPPELDEPPIYNSDAVLRGVVVSEAKCRETPAAVWVQVDGRGYCVRYVMSNAGGNKDAPLVFFNGDILDSRNGKATLALGVTNLTAGALGRSAKLWSRLYKGPYIEIGRLGTLGSTGNHLRDRRSLLEVRVVMAALDALKERYGFKRFNLVGQSGGGHTVVAMAQMRDDLGCVVSASGGISVKSSARDLGYAIGTKIRNSYDPIDFIATMRHRPGLRLVVMSDPDDKRVSFHSQREFAERVKAKGLPILLVTAGAGDKDFHGLAAPAIRLATDCANEVDDADLLSRYQNKIPPSGPTAARPH
jgi:pimeloyl-ACP methyl ester carboxylesterase